MRAFIEFQLTEQAAIAAEAGHVPLSAEQATAAQAALRVSVG